MHQYEQLVAPGDYHEALVRLVHEQGHFGVDRTCEQLRQRAYWYGWKKTVKTSLVVVQIVHSISVGSHLDRQDFNQWYVEHHGVEWQSISQGNIRSPEIVTNTT